MKKIALGVTSVLMLALTACAAPASDPSASAAASSSPGASASADWVNPDAPDIFKFRATDLVTGEQIDGTDLLYKDVVLWFWAPWCPICDAEAGALANAIPEFPEGVTVLGIAGFGDVATSKTFIADHAGIDTFPNIYDEDGSIWRDFGVTGQPTMVLLNQDGLSQTFSGGYGKYDLITKVAWLAEG